MIYTVTTIDINFKIISKQFVSQKCFWKPDVSISLNVETRKVREFFFRLNKTFITMIKSADTLSSVQNPV